MESHGTQQAGTPKGFPGTEKGAETRAGRVKHLNKETGGRGPQLQGDSVPLKNPPNGPSRERIKFKHPQHKGSSVTEPASKSFPVPHPVLLPKEQERKCAATDLLLPGPRAGGRGSRCKPE